MRELIPPNMPKLSQENFGIPYPTGIGLPIQIKEGPYEAETYFIFLRLSYSLKSEHEFIAVIRGQRSILLGNLAIAHQLNQRLGE